MPRDTEFTQASGRRRRPGRGSIEGMGAPGGAANPPRAKPRSSGARRREKAAYGPP